jgi:hypothetical protein
MKFIPLEYEILKGLPSTSGYPAPVQPRDIPGRVISIFGDGHKQLEANFQTCEVKHHQGFFFEERNHDWGMQKGKFYFYSRVVAPAAQDPENPETGDAMVVYMWMQTEMSIDGVKDGRSVIKGVCRGVEMSLDIVDTNSRRNNKPASWEASFSCPSAGQLPLEVAADLARAQLLMIDHGNRELTRRQTESLAAEHREEVGEANPAPAP